MSTIELKKKELPELEFPLDYPACLERIIQAAEYRADYEIALSKIEQPFFSTLPSSVSLIIHKSRSIGLSEMGLKTKVERDKSFNDHIEPK